MNKKLSLLTAILFLSLAAIAQHSFGVSTSEWSSINSIYLNPASIAGCHERVAVNLISLNIGVDNNLGTFTKIGDLGKVKSNDTNTNASTNGTFTNSHRASFSMVLPAMELRGPSALVSINNKMTVALTTRVRAINQLNHFDSSLYGQVTNPNTPTGDYSLSAQKFNWTAHLWSELGLSFGMVVMDDERGQLKAGATLRHLSGVGYIALKANNMDLKYSNGKDSFQASNTDLEFASNIVSTNSAVFSGINSSSLLGNLFGSSQGGGFGGDLGVTYSRILDYGGKNSDEGHKISGSASIVDIGAINYKNNSYTLTVHPSTGYLSGKKIKDYKGNFDSVKDYIFRQGFKADTGIKATKVHMPTALIIGADYQIYKHASVNVTYIANLANRQNFGNSVYNQLTVTPRFDTKVFTVGIPITYSSLSKSMKLGLGLRLAGFFLGSDDMLALMSNHQYGFNAYFGAYVPIYRKTHKKEDVPANTLHTTN